MNSDDPANEPAHRPPDDTDTTTELEAWLVRLLRALDPEVLESYYFEVGLQSTETLKREYILKRLKREYPTEIYKKVEETPALQDRKTLDKIEMDEALNALNKNKREPTSYDLATKQYYNKAVNDLGEKYGSPKDFFDNFSREEDWKQPTIEEFHSIHSDVPEGVKEQGSNIKNQSNIPEMFSINECVVDQKFYREHGARVTANGICTGITVDSEIDELVDILMPTLIPEKKKRAVELLMKLTV